MVGVFALRAVKRMRALTAGHRLRLMMWRQELSALGATQPPQLPTPGQDRQGLWFELEREGFGIAGSAFLTAPPRVTLSLLHGQVLPAGLRIHRPGSRILTEADAQLQLDDFLSAPGLKPALMRFFRAAPSGQITEREITLSFLTIPDRPLGELLDVLTDVGTTLRDTRRRELATLQEVLGFTGGPTTASRWRMRGERDGVPMSVELMPGTLTIRAMLRSSMPRRFSIRSAPSGDGSKLDNPILSGKLWVTGGLAAHRMLSDSRLTGPLMAVIHALPASRVESLAVVLVEDGWRPGEVVSRVEDALSLAKALDEVAG